MLRAFSLSLLSLALLAGPASAQTAPTPKKTMPKTAARTTSKTSRNLPPPKSDGTSSGQSGYAAPGEPIIPTTDNGKNTPPYDGPAAGHGGGKTKTTLQTPK